MDLSRMSLDDLIAFDGSLQGLIAAGRALKADGISCVFDMRPGWNVTIITDAPVPGLHDTVIITDAPVLGLHDTVVAAAAAAAPDSGAGGASATPVAPAPAAPVPPAEGRVTGPFSDAEKARIAAMQGTQTVQQMAAVLNRRVQAVALYLNGQTNWMERVQAKLPPAPAAPVPEPVGAVVEAPVPPAPPFGPSVPGWRREIEDRLNRLGNPAPFTRQVDLALLEGLAKGHKLGWISSDLGIDFNGLKARFVRLVPEPGIVAQERVLTVLRARAGV
jgi:hypothetical protein